ncbi:MAG TPA: glycosyltransferase [Candidatus Acidoferrales bacterium]|nr:glycosyltransferase [Candidatus Acidoferrales bacterium]
MDRLRILFITPYVPSPVRVRPYGFVTQLARRGHRLTLLSAATSKYDLEAATALRPLCERLEVVPLSRFRATLNCLRSIKSDLPFQSSYCYSPALRSRLAELLTVRSEYDVAHVEHLRASLFGLDVEGIPRLYDAVDCISELFEITQRHGATWASRLAARIDLRRTRRFEARLAQSFERTIVTSENESAALSRLSPNGATAAAVVPNGVDLDYFTPSSAERESATLLYVGRMSYHANVSAAFDLVQRIMPAVWAVRPDTQVVICGADPVRALRRLAQRSGSRVTVTGTVADVRPFLTRATISVSPLRYGVGIQNKMLEAMATATPIVASPAACAGLAKPETETWLVAADESAFAHQVLRLLDERELRERLGRTGRRYVEVHYDWNFIVERLEAAYRDAVSRFTMKRFREGTRVD